MNQTDQQLKDKQEMYQTFAYFQAGGRKAKEEVKNMPIGSQEQSKAELIDRTNSRQLGMDRYE